MEATKEQIRPIGTNISRGFHVQTLSKTGRITLSSEVQQALGVTKEKNNVYIWLDEERAGLYVAKQPPKELRTKKRGAKAIQVPLTKDGQLIAPPAWRRALHWYAGKKLQVSSSGTKTPLKIHESLAHESNKRKDQQTDQIKTYTCKLLKKGRIILPKKCREELGLEKDQAEHTPLKGVIEEASGERKLILTRAKNPDTSRPRDLLIPLEKGGKLPLPADWLEQQGLKTGKKLLLTLTNHITQEQTPSWTLTLQTKEDKQTVYKTIQVPLMDDKLSPKKRHQLNALTARDTTVIQRYLEVFGREEDQLWREEREGLRIDANKLDALTLTSKGRTRKGKTTEKREHVPYDLKREFGHKITVRELKECRDVAQEMWHGYREQVAKHQQTARKIIQQEKYVDREDALIHTLNWWEKEKKPHPPCQAENYTKNRKRKRKKIPRRANTETTIFLHQRATKLTAYWLECYYPETAKHLWLPLNPSSYHLEQLAQGPVQTVQLKKHSNGRWYAHLTIKIQIRGTYDPDKPSAVLSVDLGINKTGVAVLLTEDAPGKLKAQNIKIYEQKTKKSKINQLDNQIASLQRKKESYRHTGKNSKNIARKLKTLRTARTELATQYDHEMTAQIAKWVERLSRKYNVYVGIGQLKGIRHSRRKGDGKSKAHRRELNRWSFARITEMLKYKLALIGLPDDQFLAIPEQWTSKTCSRCGSTETSRPHQALLICHACGAQLQADINGALNIAFKLILLLDEDVFDQWLTNPLLGRKSPTRRVKTSGRRNSRMKRKVPSQPEGPSPSQTSRPLSGKARVNSRKTSTTTGEHDETPPSVNQLLTEGVGVEPANRKSDDGVQVAHQARLTRSD